LDDDGLGLHVEIDIGHDPGVGAGSTHQILSIFREALEKDEGPREGWA
jgi:hypothetical protein